MILLSAAEFEVQPLKQSMNRLGLNYLSFGIGSLTAAKRTQQLLPQLKNQDVVIVGTCGTFGVFRGVELLTTDLIYWLPSGQRLGMSWAIEKEIPKVYNDQALYFRELPKRTVVASPTISKIKGLTDSIKKTLIAEEDLVENIELYSVVSQLMLHVKSLSVLLAVTNEIGLSARVQWRANYEEAATKTANYLIDYCDRLELEAPSGVEPL